MAIYDQGKLQLLIVQLVTAERNNELANTMLRLSPPDSDSRFKWTKRQNLSEVQVHKARLALDSYLKQPSAQY